MRPERRRCVAGLAALVLLVSACSGTAPPPPPPPRPPLPPAAALQSGAITPPDETSGPIGGAQPFFKPGTGVFINEAAAAKAGARHESGGDINVNFVDADIRDVVQTILGGTLNAAYTIDPKIQGAVTVQTTRPVNKSALLPLLEDLLKVNGAALVDSGRNSYRIVPLQEARANVPIRIRGQSTAPGAGYSMQLLPLRHIGAAEMARILEGMMPADRILRTDSQRNMLVVAGTRNEMDSIQDLVDTFDVDWMEGMSFALVPVQTARVEEMVKDLEMIFGDSKEGPNAGLTSFLPIQRLNAVLVISPRAEMLTKAQRWISELDRPGEVQGNNLYVYYVQNGRAAELASVLNEIFTGQSSEQDDGATVAPGREKTEMAPLGRERPAPPPPPARTPTDGDGLAQMVRQAKTGAPPPSSALPGGGAANIRIIPDRKNNALVIMAAPVAYRMVEATLRRLDIVPLQVLIEATIAEVTLTDELRYGVQWFLRSGNHSVTLSDVASGAAAQVFPGFSYLLTGGGDARVVLNALASITDVNVISAPQVLVLDNQTARLQVGDQVPVATRSAVSVLNPDAPIVNSIEFRDTGVILEVTPRVNSGGLVMMDVRQEVSDVVATRTSGIDSPTIQQRRIESAVAVLSGETVALGGLIRDNQTKGNSGIPILSSIPILGFFFGGTNRTNTRTELLVLLTPRIVRTAQDAREVTDELRSRLKQVVPLGLKTR